MAKENETVADIIAEMRSDADADEYTPDGILGQKLNYIADRLEAAHRRERGDCAKLREALAGLVDVIDKCDSGSPLWWHGGAKGVMPLKNAKAALAAPPRNCDVYNNESCRMAYHLHGDGLMTMQAFADWLFAPATEKEGGAK